MSQNRRVLINLQTLVNLKIDGKNGKSCKNLQTGAYQDDTEHIVDTLAAARGTGVDVSVMPSRSSYSSSMLLRSLMSFIALRVSKTAFEYFCTSA